MIKFATETPAPDAHAGCFIPEQPNYGQQTLVLAAHVSERTKRKECALPQLAVLPDDRQKQRHRSHL